MTNDRCLHRTWRTLSSTILASMLLGLLVPSASIARQDSQSEQPPSSEATAQAPVETPAVTPTIDPTSAPTDTPTATETIAPTIVPTLVPTITPTLTPTPEPSTPSTGRFRAIVEYLGEPVLDDCTFEMRLQSTDGGIHSLDRVANEPTCVFQGNGPAGDYLAVLYTQDQQEAVPHVWVSIEADQVTERAFDLSSAYGILVGSISIDPTRPETFPHSVCIDEQLELCRALDSDAAFRLLMVEGPATGTVYDIAGNSVHTFVVEIRAGETIDIGTLQLDATSSTPSVPTVTAVATTAGTSTPAATTVATASATSTSSGPLDIPAGVGGIRVSLVYHGEPIPASDCRFRIDIYSDFLSYSNLYRSEDDPCVFVNPRIGVGEREIRVFPVNGNVQAMPADVVTVRQGRIAEVTYDLADTHGVLTGSITIDGSSASEFGDLRICATPQFGLCAEILGDGSFRLLLPVGSGDARFLTSGGLVLGTVPWSVDAGRETSTGAMDLFSGHGSVSLSLTWFGEPILAPLCTAFQTNLWAGTVGYAPIVGGSVDGCGFKWMLPPDEYTPSLYHDTGGSTSLPITTVTTGSTVVLTHDLSAAFGFVEGQVTVNGLAPAAGRYSVCPDGSSGYDDPCTPLDDAGGFRLLVTAGTGELELVEAGGNASERIPYTAIAGQTTTLASPEIIEETGHLSVRFVFGDESLLERACWGIDSRLVASAVPVGESTEGNTRSPWRDDPCTHDYRNLEPGAYALEFSNGGASYQSAFTIEIDEQSRISREIDLAEEFGMLTGVVTIDGFEPTWSDVQVCPNRQGTGCLTTDPLGRFQLLVVPQSGVATIYSSSVGTGISTTYTVAAGQIVVLGEDDEPPTATATATEPGDDGEQLADLLLAVLVGHLSATPPGEAVSCVDEPVLRLFDPNEDGQLTIADLRVVADQFDDQDVRDQISQLEAGGLSALQYQNCSTPTPTATDIAAQTPTAVPTGTSSSTPTPTATVTAPATEQVETGTLVAEIDPDTYFPVGIPDGTEVCIESENYEECQPLPFENVRTNPDIRAFAAQPSSITIVFERVPTGEYTITLRVPGVVEPIVVGNATVVAEATPTATAEVTPTGTATSIPTATLPAMASPTTIPTATLTPTASPTAIPSGTAGTTVTLRITSADMDAADSLPRGTRITMASDGGTVWEKTLRRQDGAPLALAYEITPSNRNGAMSLPLGTYTVTIRAGVEFEVYSARITLDVAPLQEIMIELQPTAEDAPAPATDIIQRLIARLIEVLRNVLERVRLDQRPAVP